MQKETILTFRPYGTQLLAHMMDCGVVIEPKL